MIAAEVALKIALDVCTERHLDAETVLSRDTSRSSLEARVAMYQALRARGWSLPQIGRQFGRDHTTICHALRRAG